MTFCDLTIYNDNPYRSDFVPNSTFYRILSGFHRTFVTGVACRQGTLTPPDTWSCPIWDLQMFSCWDHWTSIIHYQFMTPFPDLTFTDFDVITEYRFPKGICNGCGMPTGEAYSSGHPLGLAYVLLVETNPFSNLSLFFRTMLFEYPSVLSRFYSHLY